MAWSSSGLGRRPLKAEIGGSNPLQATIEYCRSGDCLACFGFFVRLWGFEPMRWNSVKKTAQWAVFRNSPEGFSLRVRGARSAARNPLQATIEYCRSGDCLACFGLKPVLMNGLLFETVRSCVAGNSFECCISFGLRGAIGLLALLAGKSALLFWLVSIVRRVLPFSSLLS